eukprot:scaffold77000_cov54-Phaeocystis_antarctica.AAC.3
MQPSMWLEAHRESAQLVARRDAACACGASASHALSPTSHACAGRKGTTAAVATKGKLPSTIVSKKVSCSPSRRPSPSRRAAGCHRRTGQSSSAGAAYCSSSGVAAVASDMSTGWVRSHRAAGLAHMSTAAQGQARFGRGGSGVG